MTLHTVKNVFIREGQVFVDLEPVDPPTPDPDPVPDPVDPDPVDPDPVPPIRSALDYYDALKSHPAVIYADTLCHPESEWYASNRKGGTFDAHPYASYDAEYGAMRLELPDLSSKLGPGKGIQLYWPGVGPKDKTTLVVKYRIRLSKEIVTRGYEYKFTNLTHSGDQIGIELRTFMGDPYTLWDVRSYLGRAESVHQGSDNLNGPIEGFMYDRHPGPDSLWPYRGPKTPPTTYCLLPEKWYVVTSEVSWRDGKMAYRHWFEDGENPPCLGIAAAHDPSLGFLLGNASASITGIYFELDQSATKVTYTEPQPRRSVWFDDLVVLRGVKGEDVLGGEPVK